MKTQTISISTNFVFDEAEDAELKDAKEIQQHLEQEVHEGNFVIDANYVEDFSRQHPTEIWRVIQTGGHYYSDTFLLKQPQIKMIKAAINEKINSLPEEERESWIELICTIDFSFA